jgi:hypothetical protein
MQVAPVSARRRRLVTLLAIALAAATSLAQETAEPEEGGGEAAVEIADVAAQGEAAVEEAPQVNARTVFGLDDPHVHDIPRDVYVADDVPAARRATTPYLNRDFDRVHDSARLSQTEEADVALVGTQEELDRQVMLTRHGFWKRADAKFDEVVITPTERPEDGYGIWRAWESDGLCPRELFLVDPWGSFSWHSTPHQPLTQQRCSWLIRPGLYRQNAYIRLSRAPVTFSFRSFSLVTDVEFVDIYDGAERNATLLGRFTGEMVPHEITSTRSEIRLVYWAELNRTTDSVWDEVTNAVERGMLQPAVRSFALAARFGMRGFFGQDIRQIIRGLAQRAANHPGRTWLRRKWFSDAGTRFDFDFATAVEAAFQEARGWRKLSRREAGKEEGAWDLVYGPRRYPTPMLQPGRNPAYSVSAGGSASPAEGRIGLATQVFGFAASVDALARGQGTGIKRAAPGSEELVSFSSIYPDEPSGFSLDFTTTADCYGKGIATYGQRTLPAVTLSGSPASNFRFLPFPLEMSSCQPFALSGRQRTRDRPFTIADNLMKLAQEDELNSCIDGGCQPLIPLALTAVGSNCSEVCTPFIECVNGMVQNKSRWEVPGGRLLYNTSLVMIARQQCLESDDGRACINLWHPTEEEIAMDQGKSPERPKRSGCLDLDCYFCAPRLFRKQFDCAFECGQNMADPSIDCMDCSFTYEDSYEGIDTLRENTWVSYFVGAIGYNDCPNCEPYAIDADGRMSEDCRRCHYPVEDLINADHRDCLDGQTDSCVSFDRTAFNFDQDVLGILNARAQELLEGVEAETYSYAAQQAAGATYAGDAGADGDASAADVDTYSGGR